ncbi:MAG: hypothetical protein WA832_19640 [Bradyrhizobium sp.]|uniref:hypothetical protein n=1 Tax=Bradyrhizobium sp. TaxID=376 RepID=UPI003C79F745
MSIAQYVPYAQIVSNGGAAIGLFLTAWQFWRSRKTTTLQHLQEFFKSTIEREAALAHATDDEKRRHAFVEFLDFLEVYSAAVISGLFIGVAKELVRDKLIDSIVTLERAPQWHDEIQKSVTSVVTYKYLIEFTAKHRKVLDFRRQHHQDSGTNP